MQKYKSRAGRHKIVYSYTGEFDAWVPATMEFLGTLRPPTLSKRAAAMLLLVAGMGNEEIVELTGMCIICCGWLNAGKRLKKVSLNERKSLHVSGGHMQAFSMWVWLFC